MEASKQAAGVSKNTFDDLTYVGKSTLGDLTKTAKEAAAKKGLMKHDGQDGGAMGMRQSTGSSQSSGAGSGHHSSGSPGTQLVTHGPGGGGGGNGSTGGLMAGTGTLFSSFSNEITGITSSTSSMFSGLFGKSE